MRPFRIPQRTRHAGLHPGLKVWLPSGHRRIRAWLGGHPAP